MNETLGKIHFWGSIIFMNLTFMPMFKQGVAGINRRMYDGGAAYLGVTDISSGMEVGTPQAMIDLNVNISIAAWALGLMQLPFIFNFFWSIWFGKKVENDNPWQATTLDWQTPTPPPHGNFLTPPVVTRGPYEYSVPGAKEDFIPQNAPKSV
jgi:cytochrome c oxidase subunit 1